MTPIRAVLLLILAVAGVGCVSAPRSVSVPDIHDALVSGDAIVTLGPARTGAPAVPTSRSSARPSSGGDGAPSGGAGVVAARRPVKPSGSGQVRRATPLPRATVAPRVLSPAVVGSTPTAAATPLARVTVTPRPLKSAAAGSTPAGPASLKGIASYYGTGGPGEYAAMHGYVDGSRVTVVVCAFTDGTARCGTFPVVTQCQICRWVRGATLVDLSIPAWKAIAGDLPLSRGVLSVVVQIVEGGLG